MAVPIRENDYIRSLLLVKQVEKLVAFLPEFLYLYLIVINA